MLQSASAKTRNEIALLYKLKASLKKCFGFVNVMKSLAKISFQVYK